MSNPSAGGCIFFTSEFKAILQGDLGIVGLAFVLKAPKGHNTVDVKVNSVSFDQHGLKLADVNPQPSKEGCLLDKTQNLSVDTDDYFFEHKNEFDKLQTNKPFFGYLSRFELEMLLNMRGGIHQKVLLSSFKPILSAISVAGNINQPNFSFKLEPVGIQSRSPVLGSAGVPLYYYLQDCPRAWDDYMNQGAHFTMMAEPDGLEDVYQHIRDVNGW